MIINKYFEIKVLVNSKFKILKTTTRDLSFDKNTLESEAMLHDGFLECIWYNDKKCFIMHKTQRGVLNFYYNKRNLGTLSLSKPMTLDRTQKSS